jgi:hypothetical protein
MYRHPHKKHGTKPKLKRCGSGWRTSARIMGGFFGTALFLLARVKGNSATAAPEHSITNNSSNFHFVTSGFFRNSRYSLRAV